MDVCVIGAGVAGALVAHQLGRAGKTVVVLDTGPRFKLPDPDRYALVHRDRSPWTWQDPDRDAYEEQSETPLNLNHNASRRIKAIGGSTLSWTAEALRLQPPDFKMRTLYGIGTDWPLSYSDLEHYYLRAEGELGVSGGPGANAPPRSAPYPLPAHPHSYANEEFFGPAFEKLGLPISPVPLAINSQAYGGRPACAAFGTCYPMCPIGAKYTALTHIEQAEATGQVQVKANSHVRRIRLSARRKAGYIEYVTGAGGREYQEARAFVIAAGGIENARLLLLSADQGPHADGLANSSGLVGRGFMVHSFAFVQGNHPRRTGGHRTGFNSSLTWALYTHTTLPKTGNVLIKLRAGGPTPAAIAVAAGIWGEELKKHILKTYGHSLSLVVAGEVLPNPENRVRLSTGMSDKYGDPVPVIELNLGQFAHAAIDRGVEVAHRVLEIAGATQIRTDLGVDATHHMGATRIGEDPETSVCDTWGRCHDLDNLYVVGSSLFPTSGCSNPTLTIAALALRTGDFLTQAI